MGTALKSNGSSLFVLLIGASFLGVFITALLWFDYASAVIVLLGILGIFYVALTAQSPKFGFYSYYLFSLLFFQLSVYISPNIPWGVLGDALLFLNVLTIGIKQYSTKELKTEWLKTPTVIIWGIWLVFGLLINLLNIQNINGMSFIYGMRRLLLNPLGLVLLTTLSLKTKAEYLQFFKVTAIFFVYSYYVGWRQNAGLLNDTERALLSTNFGSTHQLMGILRVWSTMADSATFGVTMSLFAVLSGGLALRSVQPMSRIFYAVMAVGALYEVLISGTRAAYASFAFGALVVLIFFAKNTFRILGFSVGGAAYILLKFTFIGHNLAIIRRLRTIFDPTDNSLLVRIANRTTLEGWLQNHPFGGGTGMTIFGSRFAPGHFLSSFPPDGMYVLFRAEMGYIGEYGFYAVNLAAIIYMVRKIRALPVNSENRLLLTLFLGVFIGARVSDYAQLITLQFPLVNIIFVGLVAFDKVNDWEDRKVFKDKVQIPFR